MFGLPLFLFQFSLYLSIYFGVYRKRTRRAHKKSLFFSSAAHPLDVSFYVFLFLDLSLSFSLSLFLSLSLFALNICLLTRDNHNRNEDEWAGVGFYLFIFVLYIDLSLFSFVCLLACLLKKSHTLVHSFTLLSFIKKM